MQFATCVVIVPVYNNSEARLAYLDQCLASLARQTSPVIGLVVDDDSPMGVEVKRLVGAYAGLGDFRYVKRQRPLGETRSSSGAINHGIDLVLDRSLNFFRPQEYEALEGLCYLHSDDILPENSIELRMRHLRDRGFAWGEREYFGNVIKINLAKIHNQKMDMRSIYFPHHSLLWHIPFLRSVVAYASERYAQPGFFDSTLPCYEDWDVTLTTRECAKRMGLCGHFVSDVTYCYRSHSDNISGRTKKLGPSIGIRVSTKHRIRSHYILSPLFLDLPWSLLTWLPEERKSKLRIVRDSLKAIRPWLARLISRILPTP